MRQRILKAMIAGMLIIVLTMANFLLLTVNIISYAVENTAYDTDTDNKNIEFMAYFKDASENKFQEYAIKSNTTDQKIAMSITVKQEGYFNGKIALENSNFKFRTDNQQNERIKSISENKI